MHDPSNRKCIIIITTILLLTLLLTTPVLAEGELPPEGNAEPVPEEQLPAEEIPAPVETVPEETPSSVPPAEEPPAEELLAEEPITEANSIPEALVETDLEFDGTTGELINTDCNGTTEEFSTVDPYFTVGTTTYSFSAADCEPDNPGLQPCLNPIQAAIDFIETNGTIPSDRKIYVEGDSYTEVITINGTLPNLGTLNGLIGVDGSAATTITGDISISYLTNGFTFQGFTLNGNLDMQHMEGTIIIKDVNVSNPSGNGIGIIDSNSAVVIEDVSSSGNVGYGLFLDNDNSGLPYNVTIKNAYFDENNDGAGNIYGAQIMTLGSISMDNVSASRNRGTGIYINSAFTSLTVKHATLADNTPNPPTSSYGFGLQVYSDARSPITLENIYATGGGYAGTYAVSLSTQGSVTVRRIVASDTSGGGLSIVNDGGADPVKIYDSRFNDNSQGGLSIASKGLVYLSSIKASSNSTFGADIDNCQYSVDACTGIGTVTITSPSSYGVYGANEFSHNMTFGLRVWASRTITVTNILAETNGQYGVQLANHDGSGNITINRNIPSNEFFSFTNTFFDNGYGGLQMDSTGTISLSYIQANENGYFGANLDNHLSTSTPGIIVKYSEFNDNGDEGIEALSRGSITFNNVSASRNDFGGSSFSGAVLSTTYGVSGNITIKGLNGYICQFNQNGHRGFALAALGNVLLTNVEANDNLIESFIYNQTAATAKSISITNGKFNRTTSGMGIDIKTKGNVTLNQIYANNNDREGVSIINYYDFSVGNITIKNGTFDNNGAFGLYSGLYIESKKNVTLYGVSASYNTRKGAWIDNCQQNFGCEGAGTVIVSSGTGIYNMFTGNANYGLHIEASGSVLLKNILAEDNQNNAVYVDNGYSNISSGVTVSAGSKMRNTIQYNEGNGLTILSNGPISVNYVDIFENGNWGTYLSNQFAGSTQPVIIKDSTFIKNHGNGVYVLSNGIITLQGVNSSDNSVFEGTLDISGDTQDGKRDVLSATYGSDAWKITPVIGTESYTVTVVSEFFDPYLEMYAANGELLAEDDNGGGGTDAMLSGTFTDTDDYYFVVRSVEDSGQGAYIIYLNGTSYTATGYSGAVLDSTAQGGIKILYSSSMGYGAKFNNNSYYGANIYTYGAVNLNRVDSLYNGYYNIYIDNANNLEQPVTLNTVNTEGSVFDGIYVSSRGNISLSKVASINNGDSGAELYNLSALTLRTIKVSNSTFSENSGIHGLVISATGAVTLSSITAENNSGHGIYAYNISGAANVTLSGMNNLFSANTQCGLYISSHGIVSLSNFTADNNGLQGIYLDNRGGDPKDVRINSTLKGLNTANNNGASGVIVYTHGAITVNKLQCVNNSSYNMLHNFLSPDIKKVSLSNSIFRLNSGTGVQILANGPVVLTNVWAEDNDGYGFLINNTYAPGESVTFTKVNANGNQASGVFLETLGALIFNTIHASGNVGRGLDLSTGASTKPVTIQNTIVSMNGTFGMTVNSYGNITLKSITASYNLWDGITLTGNNSSNLTIYQVNANWNESDGMVIEGYLNNTFTLSNFVMNGSITTNGDGLRILGNGSTTVVTLNTSVALGNYGSGIQLDSISTYTLASTYIFGNDIDGDGQPDIHIIY